MTIGIAKRLLPYPTLYKKYMRLTVIYEEYTRYLHYKGYYIKARMKNKHPKTILSYPQKPDACLTLDHIACYHGFNITTNPRKKADFVVFFEDATYRTPDKELEKLSKTQNVINYNSRDISKEKVEAAHKKVFGYGFAVNPQTYKGKYVKKGNINSLHNGIILDKQEKPEKGYIYQALANNEINGELLEMRVPIFKDIIPFIFLKHRNPAKRFTSRNKFIEVKKTTELLSAKEYKQIVAFCREMGVDFGEMDMIRDKDTKRLYILDLNNTPGGQPDNITKEDCQRTLQLLSEAFIKAFSKA